jgi:hypothetical protein
MVKIGAGVKKGRLRYGGRPRVITKHWQALTTNSNNSSSEMASARLFTYSLLAFVAIELNAETFESPPECQSITRFDFFTSSNSFS